MFLLNDLTRPSGLILTRGDEPFTHPHAEKLPVSSCSGVAFPRVFLLLPLVKVGAEDSHAGFWVSVPRGTQPPGSLL